MVFELDLIAVKLVQEEAIVDLLWLYHAAHGLTLYSIFSLHSVEGT